jgi:SAM-dependent methyltransferase
MLLENKAAFAACPLCGSPRIFRLGCVPDPNPTLFSSIRVTLRFPSELWRCNSCKSGFKQNIVDAATAACLYSSGSSISRWSVKPFNEVKTPEILELVTRIAKNAHSILDVGCNTGELLDFVGNQRCITYGVEPSQASRSVLVHKGHISYSSIHDCKEVYDVIFAFDLVEHLFDLPEFLLWARDRLAPNGKLVILTGDINSPSARLSGSAWWYSSYPEHIVFPSKHYFSDLFDYRLEAFVPSYASKGYRRPFHRIVLSIMKILMASRAYSGLPALGPDHMLLVLAKCSY